MTGSRAQRRQCALPVSGSTTTAIVSTALSSGVGLLLYAETPRSQKRLLRSPSSRFRQCINRVSCSNDRSVQLVFLLFKSAQKTTDRRAFNGGITEVPGELLPFVG